MAKTKWINLVDLQVNTENYRYESVSGQKEAIDGMIDDQTEKLLRLAQDIVTNGLNPNDRIQVVLSKNDPKKYIVLEGNRRTVALKLLNAPDLIDLDRHALLKKKFKKLADENKSMVIQDVECTVYDNPSEADKWIKIKHAGQSDGVGTVAWNAQQVQRFEEKVEGKSSIALQTIKLLENSAQVPTEMKGKLRTLKVTNLDRLLSDPNVREFLGVEVNGGILQSNVDKNEVVKGLVKIVKDLLRPEFTVGDIYTKDDRKDYLKRITIKDRPNTDNKISKPWQFTSTSGAPTKVGKRKINPKDRNVLIPKNLALEISVPKINAIYQELQWLKLVDFANVAAVAFRVFIENSMDTYIEEQKIIIKTKNGRPPSLKEKIVEVTKHLELNNWADSNICKGIRSAVNNKNDLLGTETLNAYVHNSKFAAIPANLVTSWDNIQIFMERVWEHIK